MNDQDRHGTQSGGLETIELELDGNGSPVALKARAWYVCFVPGLMRQWWHRFVHERHKHVFAMKPAGQDCWTLFEPWRHRLLTTTITSEQARKFLLWGARGDVLCVRESVPGRGSQLRGWMTCAALASYLLGRPYWVWTPHGLYKLLLREPNVCRVDVSRLVRLNAAQLAKMSEIIMGCDECMPGALKRRPGAPKPFCMNCGRDLVELPEVRDHLRLIAQLGPSSEDRANQRTRRKAESNMTAPDHSHHGRSIQGSFWTSRAFLVCATFLVIGGILLWTEHFVHALGYLPYLLILACPLMHLFMHGSHGGHGDHSRTDRDRRQSDGGNP